MVVGEEAGASGASAWRWYLDPIAGTKRFIAGDPKWMTLIALAHEQRIVLGVVEDPPSAFITLHDRERFKQR